MLPLLLLLVHPAGGSKKNYAEARLVCDIVSYLMRHGEQHRGIGLVTPYTAQLNLLTDTLRSAGLLNSTEAFRTEDGKTQFVV